MSWKRLQFKTYEYESEDWNFIAKVRVHEETKAVVECEIIDAQKPKNRIKIKGGDLKALAELINTLKNEGWEIWI